MIKNDCNKIICAINEINPNTNLRDPNGCSKSSYVEELGYEDTPKVVTKDIWNNLLKTNKLLLDSLINRPLFGFVSYKEIKNILPNEKYFYIINYFNVNFFISNNTVGFACVDPVVLNDVKNNKCKIIISCPTEGLTGVRFNKMDLEIVQRWIDRAELPSNNIYFISGNLNINLLKTDNIKFNVIGLSVFEQWLVGKGDIMPAFKKFANIIPFEPSNTKNLYLNFTRGPRDHRILLLSNLIKFGVFELGENSFNLLHANKPGFSNAKQVIQHLSHDNDLSLLAAADILDQKNHQFVDIDTTAVETSVNTINVNFYKKTFISLITETLTNRETLLITEKSFKPIVLGHPFIILGSPGTLEKLKSFGYKTFDRWLDENYDNDLELNDRIKIIIKNIQLLSKLSIEELKTIRKEMEEICIHNHRVFWKRIWQNYYIETDFCDCKPMVSILDEILKNWN